MSTEGLTQVITRGITSDMRKRLRRIGNSLGLILDRPILELLRLNEDSVVELSLDGQRLIVTLPSEANPSRIPVWLRHKTRADPKALNFEAPPPDYVLEPLRQLNATQRSFVLRHPPQFALPDAPVLAAGLRESTSLQNPESHRAILKGSAHPWRIVSTCVDEGLQRTEIALEVDLEWDRQS